MFSTAAKNTMIGALGAAYASLHSAYSAAGANELTGGSPAYARQPVGWSAPAAGAIASTAALNFPVPAATVRFVGFWTAVSGGTFLGMIANGGSEKEFWTDTANNKILLPAHGYPADQKIAFYGGTPPGGLTEGTVYYVKSPTTNDFLVAATPGGATITLTTVAAEGALCSAISEDVFAAQGVLAISAASLNLNK